LDLIARNAGCFLRASLYEFFTNPPTLRLHNPAAKIGNGCAYLICYNKIDKGGHFAAWEQPGFSRPRFVPRSGGSAVPPGKIKRRARAARAAFPKSIQPRFVKRAEH
jgi:hypothetical protein